MMVEKAPSSDTLHRMCGKGVSMTYAAGVTISVSLPMHDGGEGAIIRHPAPHVWRCEHDYVTGVTNRVSLPMRDGEKVPSCDTGAPTPHTCQDARCGVTYTEAPLGSYTSK